MDRDLIERFQALAGALLDAPRRRFRLAELADYLRALPPDGFRTAVSEAPRVTLDAQTLNYLAGAIELAAERRGQAPPPWTRGVAAADAPAFGSSLGSVRLHLLTRAHAMPRRARLPPPGPRLTLPPAATAVPPGAAGA